MKTKILLADDEEDLEDLFQQLFYQQIESGTYEFFFARDGLEALALLEQHSDMDVLISDLNMPGMDGLTLLGKVSAINPVIRTIILTAYGDMNNVRTAMNRGAFDFLTKPVNFQDLEATLEKTILASRHYRESLALQAMDAMKTRFFANITHELRTPLSLIVVLIDKLLTNLDLPALYQHPLGAIQRNVRQLLRLINQLLDINKLEAGQLESGDEVGDLPGFINQIVELFRPSVDIKQLTLHCHIDIPSGNYQFDAGAWEKILYNLLSNAIKFTETGHILINVSHTATTARLTVSDTGIGIPADKLPHIFNRFYQVDASRNRAYEGTGIGLALVQELTNKLGGSIRVQSQTASVAGAHGTTFVVELPVYQIVENPTDGTLQPSLWVDVPYVSTETSAEFESVLPGQTPLVMIVEDNDELRDFIVTELASTYRVRSAANGANALAFAKEDIPDVIITDLMMPAMDGFDLIQHLRADPITDHIAIILLTASLEQASRMKGLAYGADDYLTKPFSISELQLRLRNLLSRQEKLRDVYRRQLTQSEPISSPDVSQHPFIQRLHQLLEERLDDPSLSVEWLADQLIMSRRMLYRKVYALLAISPHDLIRQYRLGKAVELLRAGHNASETAYRVGFESPSYFTKVFKDYYQQTPTDYKGQPRKNE